jgi:hypothetical protein
MEIANTESADLKFGSDISTIYQPGAGFLNLRIWISLMMTTIEMLLQLRKCTFWLKERRIWRPLLLLSAPFTPTPDRPLIQNPGVSLAQIWKLVLSHQATFLPLDLSL